MAKVTQVEIDQRANVVWYALQCLAGKRVRRDMLVDGSQSQLSLAIVGKIDRKSFAENLSGTLSVGFPSQRASNKAAPTDEVVALLLAEMEEEQRAQVLESIARSCEKHNKLPKVDEGCLHHARAWLMRLRAKSTGTVTGSVTFSVK